MRLLLRGCYPLLTQPHRCPVSVTEPLLPARTSLPMDDAVGRAALRKAGWRLIPLIALGYGIAYMDRANISFASLQMNRDLHFSASVYGFGAGLFFVSYAACELPSNLLLYRVGARLWFARIMLTWGLLAMGMMFVKTPVQFYVMRFLLGMAEAGFFPGVVFYLAQWFPPHMRARAISRFYVSLPLSTVFMGVIAGFLLGLQGKAGLAGWQWLFLIEGLPALVLSIVFLLYLPAGPAEAKWLTEDERQWILRHLGKVEIIPIHSGNARRALLDHRVWQISLIFLCMLTCSYAYSLSAPAILKSITAFSDRDIGFLVAAMYLLGAPSMILNAMHSDHAKERYFHVIIPFLLMAGCYLIGGLSITPGLAVPALAIATISFFALQGPLLALATSFLHGKSAAAGIAIMNTIGILGGFIGPYGMGLAKDFTGAYQPGLLMLVIPCLVGAATVFMMRFQARTVEGPRQNK
jgi:MFS transporter, ACS family, tartrate transporter